MILPTDIKGDEVSSKPNPQGRFSLIMDNKNEVIKSESVPEIRIKRENGKLNITIVNTSNNVIPDMLCEAIKTVVANGQCPPDTIMKSVTQGLLKAPGKVKIASRSGWQGFVNRALDICSKLVILISFVGCIIFTFKSDLLISLLMAMLCASFIFAELKD